MIKNEMKTATCKLCGGTGLRGGAGEQKCSCGAVPPSSHILDLLDQYWNIAYQQGTEGRTTDNEAGDANRVLSEITAALALLPGEPLAWISPDIYERLLAKSGGMFPISASRFRADDLIVPVYAAPAPLPVAVKALEWKHLFYDNWSADTPFGKYRISLSTKQVWFRDELLLVNKPMGDLPPKEIAQANFESRIRSALSQQEESRG